MFFCVRDCPTFPPIKKHTNTKADKSTIKIIRKIVGKLKKITNLTTKPAKQGGKIEFPEKVFILTKKRTENRHTHTHKKNNAKINLDINIEREKR